MSRWIPVTERKPTAVDQDYVGNVWARNQYGRHEHVNWKQVAYTETLFTHWQRSNLAGPEPFSISLTEKLGIWLQQYGKKRRIRHLDQKRWPGQYLVRGETGEGS